MAGAKARPTGADAADLSCQHARRLLLLQRVMAAPLPEASEEPLLLATSLTGLTYNKIGYRFLLTWNLLGGTGRMMNLDEQ